MGPTLELRITFNCTLTPGLARRKFACNTNTKSSVCIQKVKGGTLYTKADGPDVYFSDYGLKNVAWKVLPLPSLDGRAVLSTVDYRRYVAEKYRVP